MRVRKFAQGTLTPAVSSQTQCEMLPLASTFSPELYTCEQPPRDLRSLSEDTSTVKICTGSPAEPDLLRTSIGCAQVSSQRDACDSATLVERSLSHDEEDFQNRQEPGTQSPLTSLQGFAVSAPSFQVSQADLEYRPISILRDSTGSCSDNQSSGSSARASKRSRGEEEEREEKERREKRACRQSVRFSLPHLRSEPYWPRDLPRDFFILDETDEQAAAPAVWAPPANSFRKRSRKKGPACSSC